jgi:hypothetical protein
MPLAIDPPARSSSARVPFSLFPSHATCPLLDWQSYRRLQCLADPRNDYAEDVDDVAALSPPRASSSSKFGDMTIGECLQRLEAHVARRKHVTPMLGVH